MSKKRCYLCGGRSWHKSYCANRYKVDPEELSETVSDRGYPISSFTTDPKKFSSRIIELVVDCTYQGTVYPAGSILDTDMEYAQEYIDAGYAKPAKLSLGKPLTKEVKETPEPPKGRPAAVVCFQSVVDMCVANNGEFIQTDKVAGKGILAYIESLEASNADLLKENVILYGKKCSVEESPAVRPEKVKKWFNQQANNAIAGSMLCEIMDYIKSLEANLKDLEGRLIPTLRWNEMPSNDPIDMTALFGWEFDHAPSGYEDQLWVNRKDQRSDCFHPKMFDKSISISGRVFRPVGRRWVEVTEDES